jgi:hypothetical protein
MNSRSVTKLLKNGVKVEENRRADFDISIFGKKL